MQIELQGPKCPGCHARPFTRDMGVDKFPNGVLAGIVYCHDCGHILSTFMVGMTQPAPAEQAGAKLHIIGKA